MHRDLEPANILASATGAVKVLDFGLARLSRANLDGSLRDPPLGIRISSISHDGRWMAFGVFRTQGISACTWRFFPQRDAFPFPLVPIPLAAKADPKARWSPDGNLLYFSSSQDGHACIWAEHLDPATNIRWAKRSPSNTSTRPRCCYRRPR